MTSSRDISRFTTIFAAGTMLSRILGLVRDMVYAAWLPQESRAAFITAFRLPNMLRDLVGEGASNAAFVPVFTDVLHTRSEREFRSLVSSAMSAMAFLLMLMTVAGVLLAPLLVVGLDQLEPVTDGADRSPESVNLLVRLAQWTFPYLFFIGMSVFAMGALFTVRHYSTPAWSPVLLNVALIASVIGLQSYFDEPAFALVIGVWIGGVAQFAVLFWALYKKAGVVRPSLRVNHPGVITIFALLGPVVIGQAAGEVNKLVDTLFAYNLGNLAVDALYFANRLVQLPLSVFGMATAAAVLPSAAAAAAKNDMNGVRNVLLNGLRQTAFLVLPSMVGLIVVGEPLARLLFQSDHFTAKETIATGQAVTIYALGLLAFAWVKVAVSGFYAIKDTRTPVIISSLSMILNIALNVILVGPFGFKGLAAATSIAYGVNFAVLYLMLCRRYGALWDGPFISATLRMAVATAVMGVVTYTLAGRMEALIPGESIPIHIAQVATPIAVAIAVYFGLCKLMDVPELASFTSIVQRKMK